AAQDAPGDEEGWYDDPYRLHEERWISAGRPTELVRDHGREATDPPPDRPAPRPFVPALHPSSDHGRDLRRADDAERQSRPGRLGGSEPWGTDVAWRGALQGLPHLGDKGDDG
ncbi:MAG TPA: hypothetical protein VEJ44_06415, partial [Acidimicrobiales bacterium]|nr:hypothetical protein [Acidimicrobiales bacterium]